ncbi:MAG: hypothetical protein LBE08_01585, partial [Bifidobacteriaceae bacterium]|nr:hypothetical protein [Bifidobacteriaceae bacterium]
TQGDALYTQVWENKGPAYYLINALGVMIDYWHGVYVLELVALLATAVLMWRIARLAVGPWLAAAAATLALAPLARTLVGGNLVEEWAMPWLALTVLTTSRAVVEVGRRPVARGAALGVAVGVMLALRPNLAAFAVVASLGAAVYWVWRGGWRAVFRLAGSAVGACAAVLGLAAIWLASQGSLGAAWRAAYGDVLHWEYSRSARLTNAIEMIAYLRTSGTLVLVGLFCLAVVGLVGRRVWVFVAGMDPQPVRLGAPQRWIALVGAAGWAANLAANLVSGNPDPNYMMTFVPLLAWPIAYLMAKAVRVARAWARLRLVWAQGLVAGAALGLAAFAVPVAVSWGETVIWEPTDASRSVQLAARYLDAATSPGDRVALIGFAAPVYYAAQRAPALARSYDPMSTFSAEFKREWCDAQAQDMLDGEAELIAFSSPTAQNSWLTRAVSPELGAALTELLEREYRPVDNPYGWAVYRRTSAGEG